MGRGPWFARAGRSTGSATLRLSKGRSSRPRIILGEQLTRRSHGSLDLPERTPAIVAERIQRTDFRQRRKLVAAQTAFFDEIFD